MHWPRIVQHKQRLIQMTINGTVHATVLTYRQAVDITLIDQHVYSNIDGSQTGHKTPPQTSNKRRGV